MRIGINLLSIVPGFHAGIYSHTRNILHKINEIDHGHKIILFTNKEGFQNLDVPEDYSQVKLPISGHSRVQRLMAEQILLPIYALREGINVLHSVDYIAPVVAPVSTSATIHDMNYKRVPEGFSWVKRKAMGILIPLSAASASQVFTVSEFSRQEIIDELEIDPNKLNVIPNALPHNLVETKATYPSQLASIKDNEYLLYVGTTHPHKNIPSLIKAVSQLDPVPPLVICGPKLSDANKVERLAAEKGIDDQVYLPGYVEDGELAGLYEKATAYVHPSLYEGFGMPLLEAMYFETPVLASDIAAIPEVAGDAAVYFDPNNPSDIADKISDVLENKELQDEMINKGTRRLDQFSWKKSGEKLVKCLEDNY